MAVPSKIDSTLKIYKDTVATSSHPFSSFSQTISQSSRQEFEMAFFYLVVLIFVGDLECLHGSDHCLHGCEDVLIDQFGETPFVLV